MLCPSRAVWCPVWCRMANFVPPNIRDRREFDVAGDSTNGLLLANKYIPTEILFEILSHCDPEEILKYSGVCRTWYNITRSDALWATIYRKKYNRAAKNLPWYIHYCLMTTNYFDTNLLLNGNGQRGVEHWVLRRNNIYGVVVERPPVGVEPLPLDVPEFNNQDSCFSTRMYSCHKMQQIELRSQLFRYILDKYRPHICLSEWTAGPAGGYNFRLRCGFVGERLPLPIENKPFVLHFSKGDEALKWKKIEITITDYPEGIEAIKFKHEATPCGTKMAGGMVKILFNSIEPLPSNENGHEQPRRFTAIRYSTNAWILRPQYRYQPILFGARNT